MRIFVNILMACLLIFGFAAFANFHNALVNGSPPTMGYTFLCLSIICGALIYLAIIYTMQQAQKLAERQQAFIGSVVELNSRVEEQSSAEQGAEENTVEYAQLVVDKINVDFSRTPEFSEKVLSVFSKEFGIANGLFYTFDPLLNAYAPIAKFAYYSERELVPFKVGEGVNGQAVKDCKAVVIDNLQVDYIHIVSGLGKTSPKAILLLPIVKDAEVVALLEMAFLNPPAKRIIARLEAVAQQLAKKITILQEV